MNEVIVEQEKMSLHSLMGSIWEQRGEICLFVQVKAHEFCLVDIRSGNRLTEPSDDYDKITKDATKLADRCEITIRI